jgi:predicted phage tail protein
MSYTMSFANPQSRIPNPVGPRTRPAQGAIMPSRFTVALSTLLLLAGCSGNDDAARKLLELQKQNLALKKLNQEMLEKINLKEQELARRERELQISMKVLDSRRKELLQKEAEVKKLIDEEKRLSAEIKEDKENAEQYAELVRKRVSFLNGLATDWAKAALSAPHMPGELDAEMEKELDAAISQNKSNAELRAIYDKYYEMARTLWYNNIQYCLQQNDVMRIKSDEEFENTAAATVQKFVKANAAPEDFEVIEKTYQKIRAEKKGK